MKSLFLIITACMMGLFFSSCAINTAEVAEPTAPPAPTYVNPYPAGTYEHFTHRQDYLKTLDIYRNEAAYAAASSNETRIEIDLGTLRGRLYNGQNVIILDYPIAGGKAEHPTPKGSFKITEKIVDKESNLYGKIYDANGALVKGDADSRKDAVPAGGRFDGADMPYWMRLTSTGIGMHQGYVPRHPASHGCIRHTMSGVQQVFAKVRVGTSVTVL